VTLLLPQKHLDKTTKPPADQWQDKKIERIGLLFRQETRREPKDENLHSSWEQQGGSVLQAAPGHGHQVRIYVNQ
jgi:hypothetical protein